MVDFQLDGAHPEHRAKIEGIIRGLCARYPWVPLKTVRLYEPDEGDRSLGNADEPGEIALNAFWFADDAPTKLEEAAHAGFIVPIGGQNIGWHGGGDSAAGFMGESHHVLVHEFFHCATDVLPAWREWTEPRFLAATRNPKLAPSGYALSGFAEFWAEACAGYVLGVMEPDGLDVLLAK